MSVTTHNTAQTALSSVDRHKLDQDKQMGKDIAFGIQQTLACWATDFIDPPVSKWFQNKFGDKNHVVTNHHVWWGEIAGDSAAFFAFMAIKRGFAAPVRMVTKGVRSTFNPLLDKLGERALAQEGLKKDTAEYQQKLEEYKDFQAGNMVDSTIVATSATTLNVLAQKYMFHNGQNLRVIGASKLVGAAATMSLMLGLRTTIPNTTKSLDDELSDRYFSRVIKFAKKAFGVEQAETVVVQADKNDSLCQLEEYKKPALLHMVAGQMRLLSEHAQDDADLINKEKRVLVALADTLKSNGAFATQFAKLHEYITGKLYQNAGEFTQQAYHLHGKTISEQSVRSILKNRRRDLAALIQMLDTPMGMNQIITLDQQLSLQLVLEEKKREEIINTLLQPHEKERGEPAVHIYANAKGQILEHDALAYCFNPDGALTHQLTKEMQSRLPGIEPDVITAICKNYMADRQHAALLIVDACQLDGDIVNEALTRSAALQQGIKGAAASMHVISLSQ